MLVPSGRLTVAVALVALLGGLHVHRRAVGPLARALWLTVQLVTVAPVPAVPAVPAIATIAT